MVYIKHPGYNADGFSTCHGLEDYNRIHELNFLALIRKLRLEKGRFLDIGCGNGIFLDDIQGAFPDVSTIGVDFKEYESRVKDFRVGDARSIHVDSHSVDFVVSTCVSQWIRNRKDEIYREIFRVLTPGGAAVVFPCNLEDIPIGLEHDFKLRKLLKGPYHVPVNQLVVGIDEDLAF